MDKRSESKLNRKRLRLKYGLFLKKNGLYVVLGLCLAAAGAVAAVIFAASGGQGSPAEHNYDQRLGEAVRHSAEPTSTPITIVLPGGTDRGAQTASPRKTPLPTIAPDFTPAPSFSPAPTLEPITLNSPVDGSVIRIFAMDCLIYSKTLDQWMTHPGVDIAAPKGSEVRAVAAGTVERVYKDDMLGVTVVLSHPNGMRTVYANLKEEPPVSQGQQVESRAVIGSIGDTAISECSEQAHLHFELHIAGVPTDPKAYVMFPEMPA